MLAVDTNVVVRLLTEDEPLLASRARELFQEESIFLPKTLILEIEWVLRGAYGFDAKSVAGALERLLALPNINCEDAEAVADAIQWARSGIDFADALHLASSRAAGEFVTFDRKLARRAAALTDIKIRIA